MSIYVVTLLGIGNYVSKVFKVEVSEKAKTYKIINTPYSLYRILLPKNMEYLPMGTNKDLMYGTDLEKLLKEWEKLADIEEEKELERHDMAISKIKGRVNVVEEI